MQYEYKRDAQTGIIVVFPQPGYIRMAVKRDGKEIAVRKITTYAEFEKELKAAQKQFESDGWVLDRRHGRPPKEISPAVAELTLAGFKRKAEKALLLWKNHDYDNLKDAIQEALELVRQTPPALPDFKERLQKMLLEVRQEAEKQAKKSPQLREYLKEFLQ